MIINNGKIVADGSSEELRKHAQGKEILRVGIEGAAPDDAYEKLIIGGVYGAGFSQMIGEMFDVMVEVGVMNDFIDNITDTNSKFFDIYARVGVRFRIYDARR
jgi:ABC-type multidrug transport system ATPase subunit